MCSYLALKLGYINKSHTHTVSQLIMRVNKPTVAYKLVQLRSIIMKNTHKGKQLIT